MINKKNNIKNSSRKLLVYHNNQKKLYAKVKKEECKIQIDEIKDKKLNLNIIKERIEEFKRKNTFEEKEYFLILEDLEKLYSVNNNNSFFSLWKNNNENIKSEKIIFEKYLVENLVKKVKYNIESKNYEESLNIINNLEKKGNFKKYININELEYYKIVCETIINSKKIDCLFENKKYEDAIKLSKNLITISKNHNQFEFYSKKLNQSKIKYIKNILEQNLNYLKSDPNFVIKNCEKILKDFQYESKLSQIIYETKELYAKALEIFIEEKINKNEECKKQYEKYKSLIETNNIKENKLEEFNQRFLNFFKDDNQNNNELNNNNIDNFEYNSILIETINNYLEKIKIINQGKINENLENDIITQIYNYNEELKKEHHNIKNWLFKNKDKIQLNEFRGNVFAIFNIINKKIVKYDIRPIQLISLLFLTKKDSKLGGIFLQINTGEGKSLIIQFLAAYLSLLGNKVDIVSSSVVLADRDAEDKNNIKFYNKLGLTVGCASKDQYSCDIVYGDTQNFQSGILREEYKGKKIRKKRPFDCVIIDEVDSISLDNIVSMTQLTQYFPGRSCFYFFYYQILMCYCQLINELSQNGNDDYYIKHPKEFKEIITSEIKRKFIGKILENDGKTLKKDSPIVYPKTMKKYIEDSINIWINNVIKAPSMIENRDFIVKNNNIIPVDYCNTGVLHDNMVWDGGLQQILQIIYNVKGTYENENTNFLSNISFFKRYKGNIFGVTGTFGGENFQYILREIYKINLYKIPPNKTSLLIDEGGIVCIDEKKYKEKILNDINKKISMKRSVLLICNSIAIGKEFYDILIKNYGKNVMKYFTEDDKESIEKILETEKIIVATNLAGRGTDIKISDELEKNGGLHVLVTFLPLNQRIEEQNYGRAGRKGQKGSHILIMLYKNEYGNLNNDELNIKNIKKIRDKNEYDCINLLKENEMKKILLKEEVFKDFCKYLKKDCDRCDIYEKSNIEEKWGIILKNNNIDDIKNNYQILKSDKKDEIQNNLIKIKQIINYSDNPKNFFKEIFKIEPDYSWAALIKYSCILAKEKTTWNLKNLTNKFKNQQNAIEKLNIVKEKINLFIDDLSTQSTLNKLTFSFLLKIWKKLKIKILKQKLKFKMKIEKIF